MEQINRILFNIETAVVVFLVVGFIFTIALSRKQEQLFSSKREKQAIEQVLFENAMAASYNTPDNTLTGIMTIVGRRRSIDTSKCPDDFRSAYKRYVRAWDDMLNQLLLNPGIIEDEFFQKPLNELDIDFDSIFSRNSAEDSGFQARIQAMLQRQNNGADLSQREIDLAFYSEQIANAWIAVQTIGAQHGANP